MLNRFKTLSSALAIASAVLVPLAANGQTHYEPRISVGGRAGMSLSRMDFSPSVTQSFLPGSCGAVSFRYTEEKLFGLVAEIGWTQRGWKENFETADALSFSRSLTYIKMPVMTQIIFGGKRFKTFFNIGPEFGYMVSDGISSNFDYSNPTANPSWPKDRPRRTEQMTMDVKNKFDYGLTGGVGFEFYVQPRHSVTVEGRYYFGLGNIFPATKADVFSASRCTSIEVSLGYNFRIR